jgi:hypothetical protein
MNPVRQTYSLYSSLTPGNKQNAGRNYWTHSQIPLDPFNTKRKYTSYQLILQLPQKPKKDIVGLMSGMKTCRSKHHSGKVRPSFKTLLDRTALSPHVVAFDLEFEI